MIDAKTRFFNKVNKTKNCWIWKGCISKGYGRFSYRGKVENAHVVSYIFKNGSFKKRKNIHIDHLCKNTSCVHPNHLEKVTRKINLLRGNCPSAINSRKTHCIRGHKFDKSNTRINKAPFGMMRTCKACRAKYMKKYQKKYRAKK